MTSEDKKTAFYNEHQSLSAKMHSFHGWQMPMSYKSVVDEHKQVRRYAGVFDVSHMGEIFVKGKEALHFLQEMTVNDVSLKSCSSANIVESRNCAFTLPFSANALRDLKSFGNGLSITSPNKGTHRISSNGRMRFIGQS